MDVEQREPKKRRLSQIAVPAVLYGPLVSVTLLKAAHDGMSAAGLCGLVGAGLMAWTLVEYLMHRVVFHCEPTGDFGRRLVYLYHGRHHDFPSDTSRLVMSPGFTMPLAACFYAVFWAIAGPANAGPLFSGLALGYLAYETVHFLVHAGHFRGRSLMRRLRRYHLGHHYRDDGAAFGVTTPVWDFLFGTRQRSPTYSSYPLSRRIQTLR